MRVASRGLLGIGSLLLALSALSGCVDERSFYMTTAVSPCVSDGLERVRGTLDVRGGQGYAVPLTMTNQLLPTAIDGEPERNRLVLKRFEVDLDLSILNNLNSSETLDSIAAGHRSFDVLATAAINPSASVTINGVPVIPTGLVRNLKYPSELEEFVILVKIRAVAEHNGAELKSAEFEYPVLLCRGCLVTDLGKCSGIGSAQANAVTNNCGLPQESRVACCDLDSSNPVCLNKDDLAALTGAGSN
jgi:hypothetical protein